ncbi:MAG: ferrochelatase [Acidimicrobiales bacterium]
MTRFDAVLLLSFGGPEGPEEVLPFLRNVTRGRDIPDDRLAAVGAHYAHFDGVSPINEQCRRLRQSLADDLTAAGHDLPVYWGNRNWRPFLVDTVQQMADDGITRALVVVTSAYSSYSGCRQYLEDLDAARTQVGPSAPEVVKIRQYFDHPGFVEPFRDGVRDGVARLGSGVPLVFTAHSIPMAMADASDYEKQLRTTAALVAEAAPASPWTLAWQSRSGPPTVPWLEPDISDHLRDLEGAGHSSVVVAPIGFVSDHMEVIWDLDTEAQATADELGMTMIRTPTPGTTPDPRFVTMWRELLEEQLTDGPRRALSALPARPTPCAAGCCPSGRRPPPAPA